MLRDVESVVADELRGTLTCLLVQFLGKQTSAHTHLFAELHHTEVRVHVVLLHNAHHAVHEGLHALLHLLGVGLHTLLRTLGKPTLVAQDALYALLQLLGGITLAQHLFYRTHQAFGLTLLQRLRTPTIEPAGQHRQGKEHQRDKPPTLPEIGRHVDGNRDSAVLTIIERRLVLHLEHVIARWQTRIAHAVLT